MVNQQSVSNDLDSQNPESSVAEPPRRTWKARLRTVFLRCCLAAMLLLAIGFVWDQVATRNFRNNYPPPGEILEIDGVGIHAVVRGERTPGEPAIILEPGMNAGSSEWLHVVRELEPLSQVVIMDRRGIGYSGGDGVRTPDQNIADLKKVLELKGIDPPYLLVGHSLGGHNIRLFEAEYSGEVAGMILVDALNTDHLTTVEQSEPPLFLELIATTGVVGSTRLLDLLFRPPLPENPDIEVDRIVGLVTQGRYPRGVLNHWHGSMVDWEKRKSQLQRKVEIPVTVISANGPPPPISGLQWKKGQEALRHISPDVKHIDLGGDHAIHMRKPGLIVDEISAMLEAI